MASRKTIIATITIAFAAAASPAAYADGLGLYDSEGGFHGYVNNNQYDPNSIANPYGQYGSQYSPDSVNNPYSRWGSPYSPDSIRNPYATGSGADDE